MVDRKEVLIPIGRIHLSEKNRKKLLRDFKQIECMRKDLEEGRDVLPIDVLKRSDGDFDVDDGRHRFLAYELAGFRCVLCRIL